MPPHKPTTDDIHDTHAALLATARVQEGLSRVTPPGGCAVGTIDGDVVSTGRRRYPKGCDGNGCVPPISAVEAAKANGGDWRGLLVVLSTVPTPAEIVSAHDWHCTWIGYPADSRNVQRISLALCTAEACGVTLVPVGPMAKGLKSRNQKTCDPVRTPKEWDQLRESDAR